METEAERDAALAAVRAGRYADSSLAGVESHRRFIIKALDRWKLEPYPPTIEKVEMVAAVLKCGIYRSAANYLSRTAPTQSGRATTSRVPSAEHSNT